MIVYFRPAGASSRGSGGSPVLWIDPRSDTSSPTARADTYHIAVVVVGYDSRCPVVVVVVSYYTGVGDRDDGSTAARRSDYAHRAADAAGCRSGVVVGWDAYSPPGLVVGQ